MEKVDLTPAGIKAMQERYIEAVKALVPLEGELWPDGYLKTAECEDAKIRDGVDRQIAYVLGLRETLDGPSID